MNWKETKIIPPEPKYPILGIINDLENHNHGYYAILYPPSNPDDEWGMRNSANPKTFINVPLTRIRRWTHLSIEPPVTGPVKYKFEVSEVLPERIYKYTSYDSAESILKNGTLRFNHPSSFNDPFDCSLDGVCFDENEISDKIQKEINEIKILMEQKGGYFSGYTMPDIYKYIQNLKVEKSSVTCFSLNENHALMWGHYGSKYEGVCLEFDSSVGYEKIFPKSEIMLEGKVNYGRIEPVNYLADQMFGLSAIFLWKNEDWRYEQEYRYVAMENAEYCAFDKRCLTGITFGLKCTEEKIKALVQLGIKHGFSHLNYKKSVRKHFEIVYEDIDPDNYK